MILNKYFILNLPELALVEILSYCVEKNSLRYNIDNTKCVVKLHIGSKIPTIMRHLTEFNHNQIRVELKNIEWQSDII